MTRLSLLLLLALPLFLSADPLTPTAPAPLVAQPSWFTEVSAWVAGTLAVIAAWFARVVGQSVGRVAAALVERFGGKLAADREALIAEFVEEHVRAAEEKHLSDQFAKAGDASAAKLKYVVDAVKAKWPNLSPEQIDVKVHAAIQKLPGVGATP